MGRRHGARPSGSRRRRQSGGQRCAGALPQLRRPVRRGQRAQHAHLPRGAILPSQLKLANLALAEFEAAGYVERQAVVTAQSRHRLRQLGTVPARPPPVPQGRRNLSPHRRASRTRPTLRLRSPKRKSRWGTWTAPRAHIAADGRDGRRRSPAALARVQPGRTARVDSHCSRGDAQTALRQFERAHAARARRRSRRARKSTR